MKNILFIISVIFISISCIASDYFDYLKSIGITEINVKIESRAKVQNTKKRIIKVAKGKYQILDVIGNGTIVLKSAGNIVELDHSHTDFLEQLKSKNGKTYMDWFRSKAKEDFEKSNSSNF